mmetsp:Transcript_22607/g.36958  ORF Transcript_22607/g.36958 Transcript_22607/m.36958 type:complete len:344 (+) Transcript_22607:3294-4325(+)
MQFVHQQDNFRPQLLVHVLVPLGERTVLVQGRGNPAVLHLGEQGIIVRDDFQSLKNLRFEGGLHRGERHVGLFIFVIVIFFGNRIAIGVQFRALIGLCLGLGVGVHNGFSDSFALFAHLRAKGRLKIDHVAQQDVFAQKLVAPDGDGLKGQRAFAEARNHGVATGLDALGDGNFAFAAQQLDRTHFAQIHPDGVVGAVQLFLTGRAQRQIAGAFGGCDLGRAFLLFFLSLFIFDDIDAHLGQHRHDVFDLFGTHLIRGQHGVELIVGNVALFAGLADHLFDGGLAHIQRVFGVLIVVLDVFVGVFRGHPGLLHRGSTVIRLPESPKRIIHALGDSATRVPSFS